MHLAFHRPSQDWTRTLTAGESAARGALSPLATCAGVLRSPHAVPSLHPPLPGSSHDLSTF